MRMDGKRSIQDIIPPARSRPVREKVILNSEETPMSPKLPLQSNRGRKTMSILGIVGIALVVVGVIGAAFAVVSFMFHRATLTITPYAFQVAVAETYPAGSGENLLSYETPSVEETLSKQVPSTRSEHAEDRAQGTITIFNEYSEQSQRLITNTRFQAENGLVYRIKSPVTVPGYKTSGAAKTPGTIEVTVYADEPGENYNIGPTSFTIPGLSGTPQFETMYARSSAVMSGGFVGEKAVVEKSVRDAAVAELKSALDREARAKLTEHVAENQLLVSEATTVEFIEAPDKSIDTGAEISIKAVARAPVFTEAAIARRIAASQGIVFEGPLKIMNRESITLQAETTDGSVTALAVSGDVILEGEIDTDALVREIAGKDRGNVGAILTRYPAIRDLNLSVYPFWRQSLPKDPAQFTVRFDE